MDNREYIIIKHSKDKVWIIINSYVDTAEIRPEIESDIQRLGIQHAEVFFDFAIQSGRYNRFLYGYYSERKLSKGIRFVTTKVNEVSTVFNGYLRRHKEIITQSMLSTREKQALLQLL